MDIPINRYFLNHPEMILGNLTRKDTLYGGQGYSVTGSGDLTAKLKEAVGRLPRFETYQSAPVHEPQKPAFTPPPAERHISEGSFFVGNDTVIHQLQDGQGVPVVYGGTTLRSDGTLVGKRLSGLLGLRDRARCVLQSQNEGWPEQDRHAARRDLVRAYDQFVATYGPINKTTFGETSDGSIIRRMPNLVKFREDPDAMLVMSLEEYDEATGKAAKAAIMQKDVVGKTPPVTHVHSSEEGLLVSLNQRGTVDLPYIATLYGKPEEQVITELGDLIFRDPESQGWQTADAYLSGNVRAKLAIAEHAGPPMPGMSWLCVQSSQRTYCRAISMPISVPRGFPKKTSRLSPPNCSTSIDPAFRSAISRKMPFGAWRPTTRPKPLSGLRRNSVRRVPTAPGSWNSPST